MSNKSNPYPIRLGKKLEDKAREVAAVTNLTKPQAIRLALEIGLPSLEKRVKNLKSPA